ncbi:T-complex 11, partial [Gorgonomyces haynaldii]
LYTDALLHLILKAGQFSDATVPESMRLDKNRLISYYNDWQDITIQGCIMVIFRGAAGPRCIPSDMEKAKQDLWVLLNDSDTTMEHIALQMSKQAGEIRGKAFSAPEIKNLETLLDKTLAPDSKVFEMIQKRAMVHLALYIQTQKMNLPLLQKHGLTQMENEIQELGSKLAKVSRLNKAVYSRLYQVLLEDIKQENEKGVVVDQDELMKVLS